MRRISLTLVLAGLFAAILVQFSSSAPPLAPITPQATAESIALSQELAAEQQTAAADAAATTQAQANAASTTQAEANAASTTANAASTTQAQALSTTVAQSAAATTGAASNQAATIATLATTATTATQATATQATATATTGPPDPQPLPRDHFLCYKVDKGDPKVSKKKVEVQNQFGTFVYEVQGAELLCVPSSKRVLP